VVRPHWGDSDPLNSPGQSRLYPFSKQCVWMHWGLPVLPPGGYVRNCSKGATSWEPTWSGSSLWSATSHLHVEMKLPVWEDSWISHVQRCAWVPSGGRWHVQAEQTKQHVVPQQAWGGVYKENVFGRRWHKTAQSMLYVGVMLCASRTSCVRQPQDSMRRYWAQPGRAVSTRLSRQKKAELLHTSSHNPACLGRGLSTAGLQVFAATWSCIVIPQQRLGLHPFVEFWSKQV
jgi:hypothetical protein